MMILNDIFIISGSALKEELENNVRISNPCHAYIFLFPIPTTYLAYMFGFRKSLVSHGMYAVFF